MKKWLFLIFAIIVAGTVYGFSTFYVDNEAPIINVKDTPILACDITREDLLKYADIQDENLKDFFVEETDLATIAENGSLTYVAIDKNNNISKKEVKVEQDGDINVYHIEVIDDLSLPIRTNLLASKYFALKNKCGWSVRDSFTIDGVDRKTAGAYSAEISSRKYNSENLNVLFVVDDPEAPKIELEDISVTVNMNDELDYYFFEDLVKTIKDNKTDEEDLWNTLTIDYKNVLKVRNDDRVEPGKYLITYTVKDNDDNVSRATLRVVVDSSLREAEYE